MLTCAGSFIHLSLNFVFRKGTINQFTVLCEKYYPSLNRDPNYLSVRLPRKGEMYCFYSSVCGNDLVLVYISNTVYDYFIVVFRQNWATIFWANPKA